jgi:NADH-quinone oxidoreductase subunit J
MILVIVYVGAVAVLFLFVVMMLDINFARLRQGAMRYLPVGAAVGLILLAELVMVIGSWIGAPEGTQARPMTVEGMTNTEALGRVLYTDYIYLFQASGMILLVAMVGAIVLTLRHREGVRRQTISVQVARTKADSIEVVKVRSGSGV